LIGELIDAGVGSFGLLGFELDHARGKIMGGLTTV